MSQARFGDRVIVHYEGRLEDGTVFDTTADRGPMEFTIGRGDALPAFEAAIIKMEMGDKKTITLAPGKAFGRHTDKFIYTVPRKQLPENLVPRVGQTLEMPGPYGKMTRAVITELTDKTVTIDTNHPLAGKTVIFDIELVEIG